MPRRGPAKVGRGCPPPLDEWLASAGGVVYTPADAMRALAGSSRGQGRRALLPWLCSSAAMASADGQ